MTVIEFFEKQVEIWNQEQYCNSCWFFGAPLSESALETQQLREETKCCYQLMVTDYTASERKEYNTSNFITRSVCDQRITFYVVKESQIDINNYNEVNNHPVDESKWEAIFKPLLECLTCDTVLDFCSIQGYPTQIPEWTVTRVNNYTDKNFAGLKIVATFREIK